MNINDLPDELLIHIFSYLSPHHFLCDAFPNKTTPRKKVECTVSFPEYYDNHSPTNQRRAQVQVQVVNAAENAAAAAPPAAENANHGIGVGTGMGMGMGIGRGRGRGIAIERDRNGNDTNDVQVNYDDNDDSDSTDTHNSNAFVHDYTDFISLARNNLLVDMYNGQIEDHDTNDEYDDNNMNYTTDDDYHDDSDENDDNDSESDSDDESHLHGPDTYALFHENSLARRQRSGNMVGQTSFNAATSNTHISHLKNRPCKFGSGCGSVPLVCKRWNTLSKNDALWVIFIVIKDLLPLYHLPTLTSRIVLQSLEDSRTKCIISKTEAAALCKHNPFTNLCNNHNEASNGIAATSATATNHIRHHHYLGHFSNRRSVLNSKGAVTDSAAWVNYRNTEKTAPITALISKLSAMIQRSTSPCTAALRHLYFDSANSIRPIALSTVSMNSRHIWRWKWIPVVANDPLNDHETLSYQLKIQSICPIGHDRACRANVPFDIKQLITPHPSKIRFLPFNTTYQKYTHTIKPNSSSIPMSSSHSSSSSDSLPFTKQLSQLSSSIPNATLQPYMETPDKSNNNKGYLPAEEALQRKHKSVIRNSAGMPSLALKKMPYHTYKYETIASRVYYYEVTIAEPDLPQEPQGVEFITGRRTLDPCIAVGFCAGSFRLSNSMPGWDETSFGLHSDDGCFFGEGMQCKPYRGPLHFGPGDTIGCGIRCQIDDAYLYTKLQIFYTKNGEYLEMAFPRQAPHTVDKWILVTPFEYLYPVVGLDANVSIMANFGLSQEFQFDLSTLDSYIMPQYDVLRKQLEDFGLWTPCDTSIFNDEMGALLECEYDSFGNVLSWNKRYFGIQGVERLSNNIFVGLRGGVDDDEDEDFDFDHANDYYPEENDDYHHAQMTVNSFYDYLADEVDDDEHDYDELSDTDSDELPLGLEILSFHDDISGSEETFDETDYAVHQEDEEYISEPDYEHDEYPDFDYDNSNCDEIYPNDSEYGDISEEDDSVDIDIDDVNEDADDTLEDKDDSLEDADDDFDDADNTFEDTNDDWGDAEDGDDYDVVENADYDDYPYDDYDDYDD